MTEAEKTAKMAENSKNALSKTFPMWVTLEPSEFMIFIGMAIDLYSSSHGMDNEEVMDTIVEAQRSVNKQLGREI